VDAALKAEPGIAFASPGSPMVDSTGQPVNPPAWQWLAFPKTAAQDQATRDLVDRLRSTDLNSVGAAVLVGGFTAGGIDFSSYIVDPLPLLLGPVLTPTLPPP